MSQPMRHFVVETVQRFHVYAPNEQAVQAALDVEAFDVGESEDWETRIVLTATDPVDIDDVAAAAKSAIPVLNERGEVIDRNSLDRTGAEQ